MAVDLKREADNLRRAIALFVAMGVSLPHEAHDMLEVFERCLKAEEELARLREAVWPGLPAFVPTEEKPQEDFYIIAAESFHEKRKQDDGVAMNGRTWADIAASAYAAYGASTGNKNFRGDPMPRWDQLSVQIRTAWEAAVRHAADVSNSSFGASDDPARWAGWKSPNYIDPITQ